MAEFPRDPVSAGIDQLGWFEGRWSGTRGVDKIEEHWSSPAAGSLMGMFRWIRDGKILFTELLAIEEDGDGLTMRIKHFYPGLKGWEEEDVCVELDLVQIEGQRTVWKKRGDETGKWLIYERSAKAMQAWFEKPDADSSPDDRFSYRLME